MHLLETENAFLGDKNSTFLEAPFYPLDHQMTLTDAMPISAKGI